MPGGVIAVLEGRDRLPGSVLQNLADNPAGRVVRVEPTGGRDSFAVLDGLGDEETVAVRVLGPFA